MISTLSDSIESLIGLFRMGDPGVCGCGSDLATHDNGMASGHSPVNYYEYTISLVCMDIIKLTGAKHGDVYEIVHRAEDTYTAWGEVCARKVLQEIIE